MIHDWWNALSGGLLIGVAVSLMLLGNGRVTGISNIIYGVLNPARGDVAWRLYFLGGLLAGGLALGLFHPEAFKGSLVPSGGSLVLAGILVGFGTALGSGCTSGHGVCGVSRLSPRSLLATGLFVSFGIFAVWVFQRLGVLA